MAKNAAIAIATAAPLQTTAASLQQNMAAGVTQTVVPRRRRLCYSRVYVEQGPPAAQDNCKRLLKRSVAAQRNDPYANAQRGSL